MLKNDGTHTIIQPFVSGSVMRTLTLKKIDKTLKNNKSCFRVPKSL